MTLLNPSTTVDQHTILAELADLPPKSPRSKLEPHRKLIRELRSRGRTYRELASIFRERLGLEVAASTIHSFVKVRANHRRQIQFELPSEDALDFQVRALSAEERIAALKAQPTAKTARRKPFTFQENEPLKLVAGGGQ
jgi:hypothetical protein